jgi:hypothetical protein
VKKNGFLLAFMAFLTACGGSSNGQQQAESTALAFGEAFFNYDFEQAGKLVTPESMKWLRFVASNLNEDDLRVLNSREGAADVELSESVMADDTTCNVRLLVSNYMSTDSIGKPGVVHEDQEAVTVRVVLREKQWKVRMEGLPRSERHSHD